MFLQFFHFYNFMNVFFFIVVLCVLRTKIFNWLFKRNFRRLHGALKAVHTNVDVNKQVIAYASALGGA